MERNNQEEYMYPTDSQDMMNLQNPKSSDFVSPIGGCACGVTVLWRAYCKVREADPINVRCEPEVGPASFPLRQKIDTVLTARTIYLLWKESWPRPPSYRT